LVPIFGGGGDPHPPRPPASTRGGPGRGSSETGPRRRGTEANLGAILRDRETSQGNLRGGPPSTGDRDAPWFPGPSPRGPGRRDRTGGRREKWAPALTKQGSFKGQGSGGEHSSRGIPGSSLLIPRKRGAGEGSVHRKPKTGRRGQEVAQPGKRGRTPSRREQNRVPTILRSFGFFARPKGPPRRDPSTLRPTDSRGTKPAFDGGGQPSRGDRLKKSQNGRRVGKPRGASAGGRWIPHRANPRVRKSGDALPLPAKPVPRRPWGKRKKAKSSPP